MTPVSEAWEFLEEWASENPTVYSAKALLIQPEANDALFSLLAKFQSKPEILHTFKTEVNELKAHGYPSTVEVGANHYDFIFMVPTKQKIESLGWLARSLNALSPQGRLLFCCPNTLGASGFVKQLRDIVGGELEVESGNKCKRLVLSAAQVKHPEKLKVWIEATLPQSIPDSTLISVPGIYGWAKKDRASELLLSSLPPLAGRGADFGSGYGFLAEEILQTFEVEHLSLLEAEHRALVCARLNLKAWETKCDFLWIDIVGEALPESVSKLDFVVMNPPFHEGQESNPALGRSFIRQSAVSLKPGASLYMVANRFLSYEDTLERHFKKVKRVSEADGFKVIHAQK